jgi:diamine N-acetyltransferase
MLRSKHLELRALEKSDLHFLHSLHNNYRNMTYFFEEPYETKRELEDLFEKHIHNHAERRFILEESATKELVGVLSLIEIDEINRKAEIDIIIDEKVRGKGYGKEAFFLGLKYAFDILNLYKIYLLLLPQNIPGLRIYKAFHFQEECRLIREYFIDGEYVDVLRMCLFSDSWRSHLPEYGELYATPSAVAKTVQRVGDTSLSAQNVTVAHFSAFDEKLSRLS